MNKIATPWVDSDCCGGQTRHFDLELEKINLDYRVNSVMNDKYQHYVSYLKKFFHSEDPKVLVKRAWQSHVLPIFCDITNSIFLVDSSSGKMIRKVAANDVLAAEVEDVVNLLEKI